MKRCKFLLALAWVSAFGLPASISAQVRTEIPTSALKGQLVVKAPPEVLLDQQPARLAPGARIRNTHNLLVLSGQLVGQSMTVAYVRDPSGLLQDVWILTAEEQTIQRATAGSGRNFLFGSESSR